MVSHPPVHTLGGANALQGPSIPTGSDLDFDVLAEGKTPTNTNPSLIGQHLQYPVSDSRH